MQVLHGVALKLVFKFQTLKTFK